MALITGLRVLQCPPDGGHPPPKQSNRGPQTQELLRSSSVNCPRSMHDCAISAKDVSTLIIFSFCWAHKCCVGNRVFDSTIIPGGVCGPTWECVYLCGTVIDM